MTDMAQIRKWAVSKIVCIFEIALTLALFAPNCIGADVVYIRSQTETPKSLRAVTVATSFYGLELRSFSIGDKPHLNEVLLALGSKNTVAAIISANALPVLERSRVLSALARGGNKRIPILISGVTTTTTPAVLQAWSESAILSAEGPPWNSHGMSYSAKFPELTRELTSETLEIGSNYSSRLRLNGEMGAREVLTVPGSNGNVPIFAMNAIPDHPIFVLAQFEPSQGSSMLSPSSLISQVAELAPLMMFLRHSAGEKVWHSVQSFADLIIDDPWLTEPYGNLNYAGLLQEMQNANFHTTIGFIPWNFDRSEQRVVGIFLGHPDRFSICVHGNNHDHREFYTYDAKPLAVQVTEIKQAIARMERFKTLTHIPYDRVMVFPHEGVPPVQTLEALKQYEFMAAANATSIPRGSNKPAATDSLFILKPVTLKYGGFPLIRRYSAEAPLPESLIAVNAFLGNPLLFYVHESYFADGIGAFNETANTVNRIIPGIAWRSLGEVVRHLYQVRERDDHNFDVQIFSNGATLVNSSARDATYYVQKEEHFSPLVQTLTVEGLPHAYNSTDNFLTLQILIPAHQQRDIQIKYQNDFDLANVDISRKDLRVNLLRRLSDFRDLHVSRSPFGRAVTRFYYRDHVDTAELKVEKFWPLLVLLIALVVLGAWYLRRRAKELSGAKAA